MRLRVLIPIVASFHINKMDGPPTSVADFERLHYQDVWNDSNDAEFSGLWNLNTFKRLVMGS